MARTDAQNALRRQRYAVLRGLGFSRNEIVHNNIRDISARNLNTNITSRAERIQSIPARQRSLKETQDLDAYEEYQTVLDATPSRHGDIETPKTREEKWSDWSGKDHFPNRFIKAIANINTDNGKLPFDSFGYRMMYFMYVEDMDEDEAEEMIADRYVDVRS